MSSVDHLPYASYATEGRAHRLGVGVGDQVVDVVGLLTDVAPDLAELGGGGNLDRLLAAGPQAWQQMRSTLQRVITESITWPGHAVTASTAQLRQPFTVGDYVDFYGNEHHATNVGRLFRPGQPALPASWKHIPIGYHGRSGTIVPSGVPIRRPQGMRPEPEGPPSFGPSRRLDLEAELGFVLGGSAPDGKVGLDQVGAHIFGVTLTNDWSARDIQAFEYVPLGPHLGKSFATSISPWVTPMAALDAARVAPPPRDVPLAAYLDDTTLEPWGLAIEIEVMINDEVVSRPPVSSMYWTAAQMLAHLTVNGASLRPGDFFASGTVSGPEPDQRGSLLELAWGGAEPIRLDDGSERSFLHDYDLVTLLATAPGPAGAVITLGECSGRILPHTTR